VPVGVTVSDGMDDTTLNPGRGLLVVSTVPARFVPAIQRRGSLPRTTLECVGDFSAGYVALLSNWSSVPRRSERHCDWNQVPSDSGRPEKQRPFVRQIQVQREH